MSRWERWKDARNPATTWSQTRDHAAVFRPTCSACSAYAVIWQRCRCGVYFASCEKHKDKPPTQRRLEHSCARKEKA